MSDAAPNTPEVITELRDAWVRLYDDKSFKDRVLTVRGGVNIQNMSDASPDDGTKGFNDKASSVKFQIPQGWKAVLFDDAN
ncbi:MAG: hypothetical protein HQ523_06820 [Lentisphaerae bacterium]|nr:hypothetical protein [Lentisphaerota bacterium]